MDSKVNTLYGLRVCPVSRRVKIEMHPAIELLVKNSAYTVEMINPRILIKEISFLKRINKLSEVNILSKIFTFLNWCKLVWVEFKNWCSWPCPTFQNFAPYPVTQPNERGAFRDFFALSFRIILGENRFWSRLVDHLFNQLWFWLKTNEASAVVFAVRVRLWHP